MIANTNDVYICCDLFIPFGIGILLTKGHPKFVLAIKAAVIVHDDLDYCGRIDNSSHFCNTYYAMIVGRHSPKFGSANCIIVLPCQKYPYVLSDLTPVKEVFIACTYSVMSVIKLKPIRTGSTAFYNRI